MLGHHSNYNRIIAPLMVHYYRGRMAALVCVCQKVVKIIINKANNIHGDCYMLLERTCCYRRYIEVGGLAQHTQSHNGSISIYIYIYRAGWRENDFNYAGFMNMIFWLFLYCDEKYYETQRVMFFGLLVKNKSYRVWRGCVRQQSQSVAQRSFC